MIEFHDVANIFPMMSDEEFQALVADIKAHGQREPIVTYQGKIIDGRNRYRACLEAGITPFIAEWGGQEADLLPFILSLNLQRRHLTSGQKAIIAVEVEKHLAKEAEQRMLAGKRSNPVQKIAQGKASEQAAQLVGTNRQYVLDAKKVMEKAPEIGEAVKRGDLSMADAKAMVRGPARDLPYYKAIAAEGKGGKIPTEKLKQLAREAAQRNIEEERQKREAERSSPGYQERMQQAEQERLRKWEEDRQLRIAQEAAHTARVKEQLNAPDKAQIRIALYKAAQEADALLTRGLQAYIRFLMSFADLLEGVTVTEKVQLSEKCTISVSPREWMLHSEEGRSKWLKEFVGEEDIGSFEDWLTLCEEDESLKKRLHEATHVPSINFADLQQWIEDPLDIDEEVSA